MRRLLAVTFIIATAAQGAWALDQELVAQAEAALHKCVTYLTEEVAYHGGYGGSYLEDLSDQWGETHILRHQNWLQPPGSPATGEAFMAAWRATGDQFYLDAAKQVADSLVWGQLACGGWTYVVDFTRAGEEANYYRHNVGSQDAKLTSGRNVGTFDDNTSQACLRLLMAVDAALEQQDAPIHDAVMAGLDWVIESQYEHGGFPQRYPLSARGYGNHATYNDGNIYHVMYLLMAAVDQYEDERVRECLLDLGEFLINSQMPEPQPVWCQQYDSELRPAWARMFEPPSVTGGESSGVMRALVAMALYTGDNKYLEPIPRALDWYRRSQLPNGRWARFYELKTNRPLYFTSDNRTTYWLTYDDSDIPDHYSMNQSSFPTSVERDYNAINEKGITQYLAEHQPQELSAAQKIAQAETMEAKVRETLAAQTAKGVWLRESQGQRLIEMGRVQGNMRVLSDYLRLVNDR